MAKKKDIRYFCLNEDNELEYQAIDLNDASEHFENSGYGGEILEVYIVKKYDVNIIDEPQVVVTERK